MSSSPIIRLGLFASPSLTTADGAPLAGRATQRHRLALLALLARSPTDAVSRDVLMAQLWPESGLEQARNLLKVSVYVLRRALSQEAILSAGDGLRLATDLVDVDVVAFDSAMGRGDHEMAVSLYRGPFLEGFFLPDAREFGQWVDRERARLSDAYAKALESLADAAERRGDLPAAVEWWKARAAHDPYDSRIARRLMHAFVGAGSAANALRHARIHTRLLREELGIEPAAEVHALVEQLRAEPPAKPSLAKLPNPLPPPPVGREEAARIPTSTLGAGTGSGARSAPRRWARLAVPVLSVTLILASTLSRFRQVRPTAPSAGTTNVMAWELYRRASQPEFLRSDSAAGQALSLFRQAVELDPGFAGAHAGLARLHLRIAPPDAPDMPRADRLALATWHASRATELDDSFVEAHATLGIAEMLSYHFASAEAHLQRALELDPRGSRTREWLVQMYVWEGRFGDALEQAERALEDDPLSPSARAELGRAFLVNGRCDDALVQLAKLTDLSPRLLRAGPIAAQCYAQKGMWDEAVEEMRKGLDAAGAHGKASFAFFLARSGREEEATAFLAELLESSRRADGEAFFVAMVYAGLGRLDESFDWLERSVDDYSLTYEIMEPRFADLRRDPRFQPLLARVGLRFPISAR